MKAKKNQNNHARAKRKAKIFKMKALSKRIMVNRAEAMMRSGNKEAVHPLEAIEVEMKIRRQQFDRYHQQKAPIPIRQLNQRQKRRDARRAA